jgi:hypothetical protein
MDPNTMSRLRKIFPSTTLFVLLLAAYGLTLAPGLTWANDGADGGDLIAAAATGGIPHPTGYPLYLILARGFQWLPIGSLAYRTNLMSALFMMLAAALVCELVRRELEGRDRSGARLAGLIAGAAFGLSPLAWSQAVITEVYALNALLIVLLLYLASIRDTAPNPARVDKLTGLLFGLGLGNHLTLALMMPIVFAPAIRRGVGESGRPVGKGWLCGWQVDGPVGMRRLAWMGAGMLVYILLPLRALFHPPVNWGNPIHLDGFWWLVSARLYQDDFVLTLPRVWERIQSWAGLLLGQAGLPGLAAGLFGLVFHSSSLRRATLWIAALVSAFAIFYGTADSYVYLIPLAMCFSIWIGFGLGAWMDMAARHWRWGGALIGLLALAYLSALAIQHRPQVDASHDPRAEQFGEAVLAQAPEGAMIFAKGDQAVFVMWYYHFALQQRPDLFVVASDLLHFEWYLETLRDTYPDLVLPAPFPWPESLIAANPARPYCYVQYVQEIEIRCAPAGQP